MDIVDKCPDCPYGRTLTSLNELDDGQCRICTLDEYASKYIDWELDDEIE